MTTRARIVAEARGWLGVPWRHQGRSRHGIDCLGLIIAAVRPFGIVAPDFDVADYGRHADPRVLMRECRRLMTEVDPVTIGPADVLVLAWDEEPHHFALVSDYPALDALAMIHATAKGPRRVVERRIDSVARSQIFAAFALPGVE